MQAFTNRLFFYEIVIVTHFYNKMFHNYLLFAFLPLCCLAFFFLCSVFKVQSRPKPDGGDKRNRTADPLLAKQVLSQLSYTPT